MNPPLICATVDGEIPHRSATSLALANFASTPISTRSASSRFRDLSFLIPPPPAANRLPASAADNSKCIIYTTHLIRTSPLFKSYLLPIPSLCPILPLLSPLAPPFGRLSPPIGKPIYL